MQLVIASLLCIYTTTVAEVCFIIENTLKDIFM